MALTHILLVFLTTGIYMLAGRMVFTHVGPVYHKATPLACFAAGAGVWFLWFLLLQGVVDVSLSVAWYTFLLSVVALSFVLTRILPHAHETTFFWPKVAVGVLLTFPAFWWLTDDQPLLWAELTHFLKNSADFFTLGQIPTVEVAQKFDVFSPLTAIASQVLTLPVMVMGGHFLPATMPLFNLVIFVLAAAELVRYSRFEVTPTNLAGVTGISLFALVVCNPFFMPELVFSAYPDVLIAAILLALFVPLLTEKQQPSGLAAFPYGFMLLLLGGMLPSSWVLVLLVLLVYLIFGRGVRQAFSVEGAGSLVVLWGLPALGLMLEGFARGSRGYGVWEGHSLINFTLLEVPQAIATQGKLLFAAQPFVGVALAVLGGWFVGQYVLKRANPYVSLPFALVLIYGFGVGAVFSSGHEGQLIPFAEGVFHNILHLQFLIILPFWRLVYAGLQQFVMVWSGVTGGGAGRYLSVLSSTAFGLLWCVTVGLNAQYIKGYRHLPLQHTLQVAEAMRADKAHVLWDDRIAVLDGTQTQGYYAKVLSYGLYHHAKVRPVFQEFADAYYKFDAFHDALLAQKFDYLWLHAATPEMALMFGDLRPEASYLFKVSPQGLTPVRVYNHAGYSYKEAAAIPAL